MKKVTKGLLLASMAAMAIGIQDADAKVFTAEEINNISKVELTEDVTIYETIYSFGSHVYFNKITMADIVAAANTLDGQTDAILYYKDGANVWKNAVTDEVVDTTNLSFDITRITKETTEDKITDYTDDEAFVKVETNGNNVSEVYAKEEKVETNTLKFNGAKLVTPTDIGDATKFHEYNQNSLEIISEEGKITINETRPLYQYNNEVADAAWYGILVDLNKEINKDNIKIELYNVYEEGYYTYTINEEDIIDAKRHGATNNEFVMWLSSVGPLDNATILVTEYDEDKNIVDVEHISLSYSEVYPILEESLGASYNNETINSTTDGVYVNVVTEFPPAPYVTFYAKDATLSNINEFTFTANDVNFIAKKDSNEEWVIYQPIEMFDAKKANTVELDDETMSANHAWNQSAIDVTTKESSLEGIDYEVTITKNKELISYNNGVRDSEWYSLVVDLGINPYDIAGDKYGIEDIDIEDALRHGAGETGFVMWLEANDAEQTYTFTNIASADSEDQITIKFTVVDKVEDLVPVAKLAPSDVLLYPGDATTLPNDQYSINGDYAYNMASLTMTNEYDSETDTYTYNIQANRVLRSYEGGNGNKKYYAVIMDLGIDPTKLETSGYTILPIDIEDAKRYGASETGFVMWLEADIENLDITFTNSNNLDTVNVVFNTKEVTILEDEIDGTVEIKDDYKELVSYERNDDNKDGIANDFIIDENCEKFEYSVEGVDYTYTFDGTTWTKAQSLELLNVYAGLSTLEEYTENQKYNQEAIESVTFDKTTGEINVVFNRVLSDKIMVQGAPSNWYALVVDLGVENSKVTTKEVYSINEEDRIDANRHVNVDNASDNNLVIWVTADITDTDGKTITLVNSDNENITYDITIKSSYDEKDALSLTNVKAANITDEFANDEYYQKMVANNEGLTAVINNNVVEITTDKPLVAYDNGYAEKSYFALLIDLGISVDNVTAINGYTIEESDVDAIQLERFGAENNEFVLWLDKESFVEGEYTITFGNTTETNKYNTLDVTFKFNEDIEQIELQSVKMANNNIEGVTPIHTINQNAIAIVSENDVVTATVNDTTAKYMNSYKEATWFSVLVDFGINPELLETEGYTINEEDILDAKRHGAEGTEFVMWLNLEDLKEDKEITFTNTYNETAKTITFQIAE